MASASLCSTATTSLPCPQTVAASTISSSKPCLCNRGARRSAARLDNVIAWIESDYMESEEWFDGKPLDFSYSPIEELDLSVAVWNRLKKHGIHLIRDIYKTDRETLQKDVVLTRKGMEELTEKLAKAGFEVEW